MKKWIVIAGSVFFMACDPTPSQPGPPAENPSTQETPTPASFIGLTLEAAEVRAKSLDLPCRVIRNDGVDFPVTRDYRPERLNFTVEKGIVITASNG